ncbi:unnamed protein product [Linum tenue]|uniref:Glutaredoxin n=2 Tax=Linum tenue TaxID=586396 RepID=A0AAV0QPF9_9ROSI|nr:unnamed protein product [Linum tenue]
MLLINNFRNKKATNGPSCDAGLHLGPAHLPTRSFIFCILIGRSRPDKVNFFLYFCELIAGFVNCKLTLFNEPPVISPSSPPKLHPPAAPFPLLPTPGSLPEFRSLLSPHEKIKRFLYIFRQREFVSGEMGSMLSSSKKTDQEMEAALTKAKEIATSAPVVVFSKTYCGYCTRVKKLLTQLGAAFKVIELDKESDGDEIQGALLKWTGQRTVPNVFIGGKHIGGCDGNKQIDSSSPLIYCYNLLPFFC